MFEAIAYYGNEGHKINLKKILALYLADYLTEDVLDDIQYVKKDGFLQDILKDFSPTPYILVRWVDTFSGESQDWEDENLVQDILNNF